MLVIAAEKQMYIRISAEQWEEDQVIKRSGKTNLVFWFSDVLPAGILVL